MRRSGQFVVLSVHGEATYIRAVTAGTPVSIRLAGRKAFCGY